MVLYIAPKFISLITFVSRGAEPRLEDSPVMWIKSDIRTNAGSSSWRSEELHSLSIGVAEVRNLSTTERPIVQ